MSNLKKALFSGVFYTAIAKYSGIIISLVITAVLSRLLSPDDFGVVAVATVIIAFFNLFTDMGLSPAIIQKKELSTNDLSNIFSFTIWTGILLALFFFFCSWLIGAYYDSDILVILCQLLSINLFFASANIVPNALFYKNKEFKFIAVRTLVIQIAGGSVAIAVALSGGGLYALIVNPILSSILLFVISFKRYPQTIRLTLGLSTIKKIFSYSAYQFFFNIINYFSRNLDKLLIGRYMGMSPLGYYEKSYRLMMLPLQNITQVITPVMHPIFSDYQNDLNQLSTSYEKIIRLLAFIGFPITALLFFTSKELILILFGDQWLLSIPVFEILALSVGIQIILSSSGSIFQAANDTKSMFICGLFSSTLNVAGILTGIFYFQTLEAVAWCICITFTINFFQCYWVMYNVTFKRNMVSFFKQLVSPILATIILAVVLYGTSIFIDHLHIIITLIIKGCLFLLITIAYIQLSREYDIIGKLKNYIKKQ
ncbi:lipopolysaccharide biosynthesis protein [Parabacteroides sp. OttesenSCG-928-G07]|nr:lipopolysaccharide biosynthesis protein [Parabacteroides sp. OttesenSCG-928-G21]MDL2277993.1 lipopolysaccharide biosynthesis protein [Parabacteroides sp. OttesenSCG-928-G07]